MKKNKLIILLIMSIIIIGCDKTDNNKNNAVTQSKKTTKTENNTTRWLAVAAGANHTIALKSDGTIWGWGNNEYGQLGLGDTITRTTPTQIDTYTNWTKISCGNNYTMAIRDDTTLWAWGANDYGQLGLGDNIDRRGNKDTPVLVGSTRNWTNWSMVDCGYNHTVVIKTDGTIWSWGSNEWATLGIGDDPSSRGRMIVNEPIQIGIDADWVKVSCGGDHNAAIKTNGTLWGWGNTYVGQLGTGKINRTDNYITEPEMIDKNDDWVEVSCGGARTIGRKNNGTIWGCGDNEFGPLGLGHTADNRIAIFTRIGNDTDWDKVFCGGSHVVARKTNGTIWGWGNNKNGQLGLGDRTNRYSPTKVGTDNNWQMIATGLCGSGHGYVLGIKTDGTLWAWGWNKYGQLGLGDTLDRTIPTLVK